MGGGSSNGSSPIGLSVFDPILESSLNSSVRNGRENGSPSSSVLCAFGSILKSETVLRTLQSEMGGETLGNLVSFEVVKTFFSEHSALEIRDWNYLALGIWDWNHLALGIQNWNHKFRNIQLWKFGIGIIQLWEFGIGIKRSN
ncbi:hypothetical protein C1645_837600 [Glomus cerebriforme]|uniref:Uncharacterized protein n=1 Tax=Glomus cerebriforme TaxID=658196 RepID=A0A397SF48_9GLOM|nr:hypothetical protein C1645_837600 [Glomus cerebriforme]